MEAPSLAQGLAVTLLYQLLAMPGTAGTSLSRASDGDAGGRPSSRGAVLVPSWKLCKNLECVTRKTQIEELTRNRAQLALQLEAADTRIAALCHELSLSKNQEIQATAVLSSEVQEWQNKFKELASNVQDLMKKLQADAQCGAELTAEMFKVSRLLHSGKERRVRLAHESQESQEFQTDVPSRFQLVAAIAAQPADLPAPEVVGAAASEEKQLWREVQTERHKREAKFDEKVIEGQPKDTEKHKDPKEYQRSSTGDIDMKLHREVLYESEYPLLHDMPFLFLKLKESPHSMAEKLDTDVEEQRKYLESFCGPAISQGFLKMVRNYDAGLDKFEHWQLFYKSANAAYKVKAALQDRAELTYTLTGPVQKLALLFINRFVPLNPDKIAHRVSEEDMVQFLQSIGAEPIRVQKVMLPKTSEATIPCIFCLDEKMVCGQKCYMCTHCCSPSQVEKMKDREVSEATWIATYSSEELLRDAKNITAKHLKDSRDVSYQPDPFTQGLVICFRTSRLPTELFQKLLLHRVGEDIHQPTESGMEGRLVEDFEYAPENCILEERDLQDKSRADSFLLPAADTKGTVHYNVDLWESDSHLYARLISTNWWYFLLTKAVVGTCLCLMDLYSNMLFGAQLFNVPTMGVTNRWDNICFRYNFVVSFLVFEILHVGQCWLLAFHDLNTELLSGAGDVIRPKTRTDWVFLRLANFVFFFVQMPRLVRDIVRTLHPYTGMQEKGAAKIDGHRIFVIGYESEHMYRVQSAPEMQKRTPPLMIHRIILTILKLNYAWQRGSMVSVLLCISGIMLIPLTLQNFVQLLQDRQVIYKQLQQKAQTVFKDDGGSTVTRSDIGKLRRSSGKGLSKAQRSLSNSWSKHFKDFDDLRGYSALRDAFSWPFLIVVLAILVGNGAIFAMESKGILVRSTFSKTQNQVLALTTETQNYVSQGSASEGLPSSSYHWIQTQTPSLATSEADVLKASEKFQQKESRAALYLVG